MKNFNSIFNKYKNLYFIFLGSFWILLFFYYRFIIKRVDYNLEQVKANVSLEYLICHLFFILLHCFLISYAIYLIKKKNQNNKESIIITYIKDFLNIIFSQPLIYLQELIAPHIPFSGTIFCHFGSFLVKRNFAWLTKCFVIICCILPRVIISLVFFTELVFYNRSYYFILLLPLLLLPILWTLFVNLFTNFGERALQDLPTFINIKPKGNMLPNGFYTEYIFEPCDKFNYSPGEFEEYQTLWYLSINIYGIGIFYFKNFQQKSIPYIILFTSPLYLFATIFKVLFIIF